VPAFHPSKIGSKKGGINILGEGKGFIKINIRDTTKREGKGKEGFCVSL